MQEDVGVTDALQAKGILARKQPVEHDDARVVGRQLLEHADLSPGSGSLARI